MKLKRKFLSVLKTKSSIKKYNKAFFAVVVLAFAGIGSYTLLQSSAAVPDISSLQRVPWEGGPNYWKSSNGAQFAKADAAGWDDQNFFPISVFYGKSDTSFVNNMLDAGINTYMKVEHDPANLPLTNSTNAGMFVMPGQDEWTQAEVGSNPKAVGWFIADECDQGEGSCWANGDAAARVPMQQAWVDKVKAYGDGRFTWANYGNGIMRTFWAPGSQMNQFVQMVDGASADKYSYTSPGVQSIFDGGQDAPDWPNGVPVERAYSYGWQADQMKRYQDPNKLRPVWTFVETARPFLNEPGAKTITPDQIEGAVWSALIHEARGIAYFQHNNSPTGCTATYSILSCTDVHDKVKSINAKVKSLAPVLNTQSYYNTTRVVNGYTYYKYSFNNGTDTMLKTYNNNAYIFAGLGMNCSNTSCTSGTADSTGSKTFNLPGDVTGNTVTVVGENRTIPVVNGSFTDNFANEYTHHVYQISMASSCNLNATPSNFTTQVNTATSGQTVCLDSGDYGTFTGTNKVITIKAAPGATPQMKFNFGSGDAGFTIDGMTGMGGWIGAGASNITIKNSVFTMGSCYAIGCVDIEGAMTNIVLDGNDFTYATGTTCSGANSKIFTDTSGPTPGSALIIKNNTFANGDKDGVHIGGGSGLLIENNTFTNLTDINITCPSGGDSNHTDHIQFQGGSQITIRGNYIKNCANCPTQGITSFDSNTDGIIIENNVVDIRRPWAIELYSDKNSIVRHNTLVWYADADCDFTGVTCGMIDINRKLSDPVGSGTQVYDNITTRVDFNNSSTGTAHHNVSGQTALFVGPLTSHDGFLLSASSPVGRNAASDGSNAGVYANGSPPPPPPESTPPTVGIISPSNGASVSNAITISANASDNVGVAGVQFKLDGNNLGLEDTSSPYSFNWDTTNTANGTHTITAVARDTSGNTATSASVSVVVTNTGNIKVGETSTGTGDDNGNANLLLAQQITLGQTATIQSLSFYVTNAAGKLRMGIYDSTGPSGGPGAKIAETAEITPVVGWNTANVSTPSSLNPGTYWIAYAPSDNALAFRIDRSKGTHKYYSRAYGALPATFGTTVTTAVGDWSFYATLSLSGTPSGKTGDVNSDGQVNIFDLSILLSNYGKTKAASSNPACDLNGDNNINIFDLSILLSNYGK